MADGKVVLSTALDNKGIEKDAKQMHTSLRSQAAKLAAEYRKQGMNASEAMKKAWSEIERNTDKSSKSAAKSIKSNLGDGIKNVTGKLGSLATGTLGGLTKVVGGVVTGITAAFSAAAVAVGAIAKQSVDAYADYQQLTGGVETLFKDASSKVIDYAEDAFYTVGISANEYMETVTSFSASLISALGGDTSKAADVADMALTDMADNANKMGSSMDSIKNAYQGFAKQNYTMLDNLKLGYGGTKTEMERLLKDAQAITGVKYDINNLADVYSAIHVIQEELGIAGATALEAEKTISGSANMTKAAWENVLAAISGGGDIDQAINNLVYSITKYFENIVPVVQRALVGIGELIQKAAPMLIETVAAALIQAIPGLVNAVYQMIIGLAQGIYQGIGALLSGETKEISAQLSNVDSSGLTDVADSYDAVTESADESAEASKKAQKSLAGFDEIQKLGGKDDADSDATDVQPSANFQGLSSAVASITEPVTASIEAGDWGGIGALLSRKLNDILNAISWPNIQQKVSSWISGAVAEINGFVQNLDWSAVGSTIGETLNTLVVSVGTFFSAMDWTSLGSGIGEGITGIFTSIDWEQCRWALMEGFNGILELVSGFASGFVPLQDIDFSAATESLQGLWGSVWDFAELVGGALAEVYDTVLKPLLEWAIEDGAPASVDVCTAAFDALSAVLAPVKDGLSGLMDGLDPVITFIEDTAVVALDGLKGIFEKLAQVFTEKGGKITNIITGIGEVISIVWALIEPQMMYLKGLIGAVFKYIGDTIGNTVGWLIDLLSGLIDIIVGVFTGDWERAWSGVVGIFNGFVDNIKNSINAAIGFINGLISAVCDGINTVIRAMNRLQWDIPDWVPVLGGETFGFNLKTVTAPQIPMLAQGAVLPPNKPFLAMVGDQKHGTNVEAPLATIQEAVALVMEDMIRSNIAGHEATVAVLKDILEAVLVIEIGDSVIGEAASRYNSKLAIIRGGT